MRRRRAADVSVAVLVGFGLAASWWAESGSMTERRERNYKGFKFHFSEGKN